MLVEGRFRTRYSVLDEKLPFAGRSLPTVLGMYSGCVGTLIVFTGRRSLLCITNVRARARFTGSCALLVHYLFLYLPRRYVATYVLFVMLQDLACLEENSNPPPPPASPYSLPRPRPTTMYRALRTVDCVQRGNRPLASKEKWNLEKRSSKANVTNVHVAGMKYRSKGAQSQYERNVGYIARTNTMASEWLNG
jgi:hypothetical protein